MKVSDYIADSLAKEGVRKVFGVTGGCIVHVFDSIGKHKDIDYICTHHEQAAAIAADSYSRINENIGVAISTSGPGATNLLTGVACSYFDSIPTLSITGQVPTSQLRTNTKIRQIGFQEIDVPRVFEHVTKYVALVNNPENIRYELEKAFYLAREGRPGPVVLDICDDVQRANIDPKKLRGYTPEKKVPRVESLSEGIEGILEGISNAERPVLILGSGIRSSKTQEQARVLVEKLGFPIALTWGALDLFPDNYELSVRDFGVTANRPGNFAVQNADLLLTLGTRLDTHETGSNMRTFAREANCYIVDIDNQELAKYSERGLSHPIPIEADLNEFFSEFNPKLNSIKKKDISEWKERVSEWRGRYPICPESYLEEEKINPYVFLDKLSSMASSNAVIIPEAGCNVTWAMQGWKVKEGQRLFSSFNHSPMGYGIPAAMGALAVDRNREVMALIGDGGMMMNEQEMATIVKNDLPARIFIMNNDGYGMMKQTQETWLGNRYEASSRAHLHIPEPIELAKAHGIKGLVKIENIDGLERGIQDTLNYDGPVLCDVRINPSSRIYPKLSFGKPIEDSEPLLPREEFESNMIVKRI